MISYVVLERHQEHVHVSVDTHHRLSWTPQTNEDSELVMATHYVLGGLSYLHCFHIVALHNVDLE